MMTILLSSSLFANEKIALDKIGQYARSLKAELQKGMKHSPQKAVEACNLKAPQIQEKVSTREIQIGRVSLKNRNPNNTPKEWMLEYINKFHNKELKKGHVVIDLDNGNKGLLKPIKTMPLCLKCHGQNIDKNLKTVIHDMYPNDKAIGYKVGEIRGFFWAEY